jgi:hypothetical protein
MGRSGPVAGSGCLTDQRLVGILPLLVLVVQLAHELPEDQGVHVLAKLVEQKPAQEKMGKNEEKMRKK